MLRQAKLTALGMARATGVYGMVARSGWRRSRLLILCYHGVSIADEHRWSPPLYVRQETFRDRLLHLRRIGATVLPLDEAVRRLMDGSLPPLTVAITFDDGFFDFSAKAVPVLDEFSAHATLYLTTWYCGRPEPVFNPMMRFLLWRARARETVRLDDVFPGTGVLDVASEASRAAAWTAIEASVTREELDGTEKTIRLDRAGPRLDPAYDTLRRSRVLELMSPLEVQALPTELVDVQLHTHRHRTPNDATLFRREIDDNRRAIADILGGPVRSHFCYPSGVTSPAFLPWLREAGVMTATTCEATLASPTDDPLLLPRLLDSETMPPLEFEGWVTGVRAFLAQR